MVLSVNVTVGDDLPAVLNGTRKGVNDVETLAKSAVPKPASGSQVGDLLRYDGANWLSTETRFFEGNGNPNGKIAAPVGSRYVDMSATNGQVDWVKNAGGETNQGWAAALVGLPAIGQQGTITISGAASKVKSRLVPLSVAIFNGVAPRQVLVTSTGSFADVSSPYVISKVANGFNVGVRNVDNVAFTAAAVLTVDYFAYI